MIIAEILDFLTKDFGRADIVAFAALVISAISARYTHRQVGEARKSRLSLEMESRRPQRLQIYAEIEEFCRYCSEYYTAYLQRLVPDTRSLVSRIEKFRLMMERNVLDDMPEVEALSKQLQSMGWKMQRHLDRIGYDARSTPSLTQTARDVTAVEEIVDSFEKYRQSLRSVFAPYLNLIGDP